MFPSCDYNYTDILKPSHFKQKHRLEAKGVRSRYSEVEELLLTPTVVSNKQMIRLLGDLSSPPCRFRIGMAEKLESIGISQEFALGSHANSNLL